MMKKYEYKVEQIEIEFKSIFVKDKTEYSRRIEEKVNVFGQEGWQLSGVDGTWFYFIREI